MGQMNNSDSLRDANSSSSQRMPGSLSNIAMSYDKKSQLEMDVAKLDNIGGELEKLRKTAGLITTDMLASYMPLKVKNELAERRQNMPVENEDIEKNEDTDK